jgi:hypothetical protein
MAIVAVFAMHFFIIVVNQFSRQILPRSLFYLTSVYTQPWFLQNLTAFAPDPPGERNVLVYRVYSNDKWGDWHYPAYKYLRRQYENRFDIASKTHDQMEQVANNLRTSYTNNPGKQVFEYGDWEKLPIVEAVQRIVELEENGESIDSLQIGLYIEKVRSIGNEIQYQDSGMILPKHAWVDF